MRQSALLGAALAAAVAGLLPAGGPASAREVFEGPVRARIERVVDGDTIAVRARIWIGQEIAVMVRVRGIDAPEARGACGAERALAGRATALLAAATGTGDVTLTNITGDKYFGRVLATVTTAEGRDVAAALLAAGLARPYQGEARIAWCPGAVE